MRFSSFVAYETHADVLLVARFCGLLPFRCHATRYHRRNGQVPQEHQCEIIALHVIAVKANYYLLSAPFVEFAETAAFAIPVVGIFASSSIGLLWGAIQPAAQHKYEVIFEHIPSFMSAHDAPFTTVTRNLWQPSLATLWNRNSNLRCW